jgi:hypothetical protein
MANNDEMLDELRKIRTLLEPKPAPPAPPAPKGLWNEFKDFLSKYKVLGLAIAFIMGVYLGGLVQSLVADLLLPAIGLAIPGLGDLKTLTYCREPDFRNRQLPGGTDNLHNRSVRDLPRRENRKEMGHGISLPKILFFPFLFKQ